MLWRLLEQILISADLNAIYNLAAAVIGSMRMLSDWFSFIAFETLICINIRIILLILIHKLISFFAFSWVTLYVLVKDGLFHFRHALLMFVDYLVYLAE